MKGFSPEPTACDAPEISTRVSSLVRSTMPTRVAPSHSAKGMSLLSAGTVNDWCSEIRPTPRAIKSANTFRCAASASGCRGIPEKYTSTVSASSSAVRSAGKPPGNAFTCTSRPANCGEDSISLSISTIPSAHACCAGAAPRVSPPMSTMVIGFAVAAVMKGSCTRTNRMTAATRMNAPGEATRAIGLNLCWVRTVNIVSSPSVVSLERQRRELANLLRDGDFRRQPLHRGRTEEAVDHGTFRENDLDVAWRRNGSPMTQHEDVSALFFGGCDDLVDQFARAPETHRGSGADPAAGC